MESDGPGLGTRFTFTVPVADRPGSVPLTEAPRHSRRPQRDHGEKPRILAVDDDPFTLRYIRDTLTKHGYVPIVTGDPKEALHHMEVNSPHLVLPGTDGIRLMRDILEIATVPVIFLSAYSQEEVVVRAFELGAVDYVMKPFSPTELAARIRGALRRSLSAQYEEPSDPYVQGPLIIDYAERRVRLAGQQVSLTALEYQLLAALSVNAGRVVRYADLLRLVWGPRNPGDLRPMRTVVKNLRIKLGDNAGNPTYIFTEPRIGYRMLGHQTQKHADK